jgi:hypothetical protein
MNHLPEQIFRFLAQQIVFFFASHIWQRRRIKDANKATHISQLSKFQGYPQLSGIMGRGSASQDSLEHVHEIYASESATA